MEDITRTGVAAGRHDIEHAGESRIVHDEITLGTYDNANDGNGNAFDVAHIYGFSRLKKCHVEVVDGSPYMARYDHVNAAIRVFALDGTGEVAQGTSLDLDLRIDVRGQG